MIITIDDIKSQHEKVAAMIAQFEAQAPRALNIAATQLELQPGEHYAGLILSETGAPLHHLVLLPGQQTEINWDDAMAWAAKIGGQLPTRSEQSLLFANLKAQFEPYYHWSCEQYAASPSNAWDQYFYVGSRASTASRTKAGRALSAE